MTPFLFTTATPFFCLQLQRLFFVTNATQILTLLLLLLWTTLAKETSIERRRRLKRESNARTKANQTLEQNGRRKRQKRESKARKSARKATAAPAQSSSSTNDTNFIIPLPLNTKMTFFWILPWYQGMFQFMVYPFNSSRLQRYTLGKMDTNTPCFSCGALKWLDERVTESTKCSLTCICNLLSQGKVLPCLQEPPAVLRSY